MFIAHKNDISAGGYKPVEQQGKKTAVVNNGDFKLMSNVCPHQLSLLATQSGSGNRICPYHNWTFNLDGNPVTSGRTAHYCKNTIPLTSTPLYEFNSMLFDISINCKELHWLNLSSMRLIEQRIDKVKAPLTAIMDVFLDVDHIQTVHKGVYDQIGLSNIDTVEWHYYLWGSLQLVPSGQKIGAAWLSIYPGTMIEWQPGALFVTVAIPAAQNETDVHIFKYSDDDANWNLNENIWELAWAQDKEQAELITDFAMDNLEDSKKHFRQWLSGRTI
jgi:phenylpropionate dioxygenase-like ring-hydroxylating dioxygenase large terminal subunit